MWAVGPLGLERVRCHRPGRARLRTTWTWWRRRSTTWTVARAVLALAAPARLAGGGPRRPGGRRFAGDRCSPPTRSTGSPRRSPTCPAAPRAVPGRPTRQGPQHHQPHARSASPARASSSSPSSRDDIDAGARRPGPAARRALGRGLGVPAGLGARSARAAGAGAATGDVVVHELRDDRRRGGRGRARPGARRPASPSTRPADAPNGSGGAAARCCAPGSSRPPSPTGADRVRPAARRRGLQGRLGDRPARAGALHDGRRGRSAVAAVRARAALRRSGASRRARGTGVGASSAPDLGDQVDDLGPRRATDRPAPPARRRAPAATISSIDTKPVVGQQPHGQRRTPGRTRPRSRPGTSAASTGATSASTTRFTTS